MYLDFFFYAFFLNQTGSDSGKSSTNSSYLYLKNVTAEEKIKIEFEDSLDKFTNRFNEYEQFNMYNYADDRTWNTRLPKLSV
jgi:hypothetical protein